MKKIPIAILVVALIAITFIDRKNARAVQAKARRILYPGDTQEMANVLAELRSHRDSESQALASQLEERLKIRSPTVSLLLAGQSQVQGIEEHHY